MTLSLPVEEICKNYINGMSGDKIAEKYNCSRTAINKRLNDNGIKIRHCSYIGLNSGKDSPHYIDLPIDEICKKYLSGISRPKLAKEYGCSEQTINHRLHDSGVKMRSHSESHIGLQTGKDNGIYIDLPINKICEKYLSGMSIFELAKKYNCSLPSITKRLHTNGIDIKFESRKHLSATLQHIPYDEWKKFVTNLPYCFAFNKQCKESNRDKYGRKCFLTGLPEEENITSTGKQRKLSVHHVDMNKMQGCNDIRWKLVPICIHYHGKIHNELWKMRIIWLLNNVWNNLTNEEKKL